MISNVFQIVIEVSSEEITRQDVDELAKEFVQLAEKRTSGWVDSTVEDITP